MQQRDAAAAAALDKAIEANEDAKIDEAVMKSRAALLAVQTQISALIIEHKRALDAGAEGTTLFMPHMALWAKAEDKEGNTLFCGDKEGMENICLAAGRIDMIAVARKEFYDEAAKESLEAFTEAKGEIKAALDLIEAYVKAELALPKPTKALEAAKEKFKAADAAAKAAEEGPEQEKLEKAAEAVEEEVTKAQEVFDEAVEKVGSRRTRAAHTSLDPRSISLYSASPPRGTRRGTPNQSRM